MDESSNLKTTELIQTKTTSTNVNDLPKENPTKTTPSTDKAENNNPKINCYW
jgi:hypothetical protein